MHDALEALLPASVEEFMGLVGRHAAAVPDNRFAARQLLTIAYKCQVRGNWARSCPFCLSCPALCPALLLP